MQISLFNSIRLLVFVKNFKIIIHNPIIIINKPIGKIVIFKKSSNKKQKSKNIIFAIKGN